jgi:hypothetical protein
MDGIVQDSDGHGGSDGFVQDTQISGHLMQNSEDISNGEGSGDDLCFDEHMAQQEHGARRRYRQSIANLHFNTSGELDLQRGNRVEEGLSGRSERSTRLRGAAPWQQRSMAMEDLRRGREEGNMEGGSRDVLTTAAVFPSSSSPSGRGPAPKKATWTNATLKQAMDAVTDHGMKVRTAARSFGIPPTSLRDHLYGKVVGRKRGSQTVLKEEEETKLVKYLFKMQDLGHPLTSGQLRLKVALATQTRETPWSAAGVPGKSWLRSFKLRHPELTSRKSQGLELGRARGLCPSSAASLYCNLEELYTSFHYPPSHIWNCDESGVQAGRSGGATVLAKMGSRSVHSIEPDQKEHLLVLSCINADGGCIPNFYILKGTYFLKDYVKGCEESAVMAMHPNAWMTKWLFQSWISHFIGSLKKGPGIDLDNRHLLILDGHNSHVTLEVVSLAMNSGLDIVSLPSHTSHALQPLDVSCFKPFKSAFRQIRDSWTLVNKGRKVEKQDLCEWTAQALQKALSPKNIRSGFRKTGIWPLNSEAISTQMLPSEGFEEGQEGFQPNQDDYNTSDSSEDEEGPNQTGRE